LLLLTRLLAFCHASEEFAASGAFPTRPWEKSLFPVAAESRKMGAAKAMMYLRSALAFAAAALLSATVPTYVHSQAPAPAAQGGEAAAGSANVAAQVTAGESAYEQEQSRLLLIRDLDGEYAKALQPLAGGKEAFKLTAGKPLDVQHLQDFVRLHGGPAANPGDTIQITKIEFQTKGVLFEFNGGGRKKFHLREHLSIGTGDAPDPQAVSHPGEGVGGSLFLDYGRQLPPLTSAELRQELSSLLDFSKQSATTNWVDTLPPEFKQGVQDHHAVVGMDEDTVIAALGHPDRKVRSRDEDGNDTEDWIYGNPPAKTVFVTFIAGKVARVKEFG
jgi:hypothetical protein